MKWKVKVPIESTSKDAPDATRWHEIGRAWSDTTDRIVIVLDSLPFRSTHVYLFIEEQGRTKPKTRMTSTVPGPQRTHDSGPPKES